MRLHAASVLLLTVLLLPQGSGAESDALAAESNGLEAVREILRIAPTRNMGSPHREQLDDYIAQRFKATGFESGEMVFSTPVFAPGRAEIRLPNGGVLPLHGLAPSVVHPGNLPDGRWSGRLVDVANALPDDLRGESLNGAAALVNVNCGQRWVNVLELGARVLIFAGSERENARVAAEKFTHAPLAVPRFYLTPGDAAALRAALGGAPGMEVSLVQTRAGRWETVKARNNWLIVPGAEKSPDANKVVHLQAYKDAASFVPELTPGAEAAANLALLLRLADHFAKVPPQCTIVFSAVSDHCNAMRGESVYAASVWPEEGALAEEMERRERDLAEAEFYRKVYSDRSLAQIAALRDGTGQAAGRTLRLKQPLSREMEYRRNVLRYKIGKIALAAGRADVVGVRSENLKKALAEVEADLGEAAAQVHAAREKGEEPPKNVVERLSRLQKEQAAIQEIQPLLADLEDIIALNGIWERWGAKGTFETLSPARQELGLRLMKEMEDQFAQRVEDFTAAIENIKTNHRLRDLLAAKGRDTLIYLTLDISFGAEKMGFFHCGSDVREGGEWKNAVDGVAALALQIAHRTPEGARYWGETITGAVEWRNRLADKFAMAASVGQGVVVPSATLTTTGDTRDLRFTPSDTLDMADRDRMASMLRVAERTLIALIQSPAFPSKVRRASSKAYGVNTLRCNLRRIDPFSVEIPIEPVRDGLAVFWGSDPKISPPMLGDVAAYQIVSSDRQGMAMFEGALSFEPSPFLEAFRFDDSFQRIVMAIDAGSGARRLTPKVEWSRTRWKWVDHITLLFDAVQTDLVGMLDPASRSPIYSPATIKGVPDTITLLDAVRESSPDHYSIAGIQESRAKGFTPVPSHLGVASIFTEEKAPFKIVGKRILLVNVTDPENDPDGIGFRSGDPRLRTISYTAAKDIQVLNRARMERIAAKGVKDFAAQQSFERAEALIKEAEERRGEGRQSDFLSQSVQAMNAALRSYTIVRDTTSDLIKAVAVFMALVIPFCAFLMKLVTPWTDIRAQITTFVALFIATAVFLAFLHPAFSLSQTPMMVVLAFLMIGLAVFVMFVLHGRFDAGMQRMVEEAQGAESTESSRKTLAGVAFAVGVNNMRRRRIRTTLTSLTIVLVTFTMLSVISVGQATKPYQRKTEPRAPYNAVLYAKPGMAPISENEMVHVSSVLNPDGAHRIVRRTWTQRLDSYGGYMPIEIRDPLSPATPLTAKSLLGLETAEDGFLIKMPLVKGRWFTRDDAAEMILTTEGAKVLGITPENFTERTLYLRSQPVTLVGLLETAPLAGLFDLARLPFLPIESVPDPITHQVSATGAMSVSEEDAAGGPAPAARPIPPQDCAFVPAKFALGLPDTSYRSIAVKADTPRDAWAVANRFITLTNLLTYVGVTEGFELDDGTRVRQGEYSLGAPVGATVGGVSKVVIPICLAATIILNTMLGAVMERRKEISIYNSIGLNPTHVFVFFVAEALVFGLIGAVAGYLIGQALAQIIVHLGWLQGVNLNYSSMAVMVVIFAAIVTVVVSTLYPAYLATQASVPSGQRRWKLPAPEGDRLHLDFPFSFSEDHLAGVLAYLHAYMDMNSEASSGQFLAQDARFGYVRDTAGRKVMAAVYTITPVPFDLGVNQAMEVYGYYRPEVRAHVLAVHLTRLKGDKSSWLTVNQPFLEGLRARLLGWRSQNEANQRQFVEQGRRMFLNAPEFPMKSEV